eukprot:gene2833-3453_t
MSSPSTVQRDHGPITASSPPPTRLTVSSYDAQTSAQQTRTAAVLPSLTQAAWKSNRNNTSSDMCDSSNNAEVTTVSSSAASSNWQWRIKSSASFLRSSLTTCGKSLLQMEQTYIQALPKPMVEFADSSRAIAVARLPAAHRGTQFRAVVTEGTHKGELCIKIVAVTYSGFFYRCVSAGGGTALLLVLISALALERT